MFQGGRSFRFLKSFYVQHFINPSPIWHFPRREKKHLDKKGDTPARSAGVSAVHDTPRRKSLKPFFPRCARGEVFGNRCLRMTGLFPIGITQSERDPAINLHAPSTTAAHRSFTCIGKSVGQMFFCDASKLRSREFPRKREVHVY